jgi:hypothetical protein
MNNIGELSWYLDNKYVAIPDYIEDLTPPQAESEGVSVYLGKGDEFRMSGFVYHSGSGALAADIPDDLEVEFTVIYGTQEISIVTSVNDDASFDSSMILPSRVPLNPTMPVSTEVLNVPGLGSSDINSDASVTVDSKSPTVLFDQSSYPDSSLVLLESDLINDEFVTVTMVDEIGMIEGPPATAVPDLKITQAMSSGPSIIPISSTIVTVTNSSFMRSDSRRTNDESGYED